MIEKNLEPIWNAYLAPLTTISFEDACLKLEGLKVGKYYKGLDTASKVLNALTQIAKQNAESNR